MGRVLSGHHVKVFINGKVYGPSQEFRYIFDHQEMEIEGIDSMFPQEIAPIKQRVSGSVSGIRIKNSAGLQGVNARTDVFNLLASPYISIRIQDRTTGEDIVFIPQAKISDEEFSVPTKGMARLSFKFKGIAGYQPSDRVST